ncbi:hypothetical protein AHAS_Ahas03G0370500 [Arachis hypogaea]
MREIFMLFRPMLLRGCTLKVRSCTLTPSCEIYTLSREICVLASSGKAEFNELRDKFRNELLNLKQKKDLGQTSMQTGVAQSSTLEGCVRDPQLARFPKRERNDLINHPLVKGG